MTNSFNKYSLCLLLLVLPFLRVSGQATAAPSIKVTPPSPEVSVKNRYGEYGCSSYMGMVDISVPLFEVASNQLKLPISIRYVSNGKKVVGDRSSIGTGWMLEASGVVSRTIYGMPD
jgi:hypothetical protein